MICPNCGFDNPNGSFCGNCGSSLPAQAVSIYQPPTPKRKGKKVLMVAIVAIIVVVAVVLAAMMFVLPKASDSTPESAIINYFDGAKAKDANKTLDSTILHFDTANRTGHLNNFTQSTLNVSFANITITGTEDISMSNVPADIKLDATNFTTSIQKYIKSAIQESQFVKVTMKWTNSSTDSYSMSSYQLVSKVDGKWYFDIYVSYSTSDWAADRSMTDKGLFPGNIVDSTPIGSFSSASNSTGKWSFSLSTVSSSTLSYYNCEVRLTVGGHTGGTMDVPSNLHVILPVTAGAATGYELTVVDYGTPGYASAGDSFTVGPFTNATGLNAWQPTGTQVTLTMLYIPTGGVIASMTFTV